MSLGLAFWIVFLVVVIFGAYRGRSNWGVWAGDWLPILFLIFLLGWEVFGFVLRR